MPMFYVLVGTPVYSRLCCILVDIYVFCFDQYVYLRVFFYLNVYCLVWFGLFSLVWFVFVWFVFVWFGLVWFGLVCFCLVCFCLVWLGLFLFGLFLFDFLWLGLFLFFFAKPRQHSTRRRSGYLWAVALRFIGRSTRCPVFDPLVGRLADR